MKLVRWDFIRWLTRPKRLHTDSNVTILTGPKGSGKSLIMSRILFNYMHCAGKPVWSTMPVKTPDAYREQGVPLLETKTVDWDALYTLSEGYQDGVLGLDESVYFSDKRNSLTLKNRILNVAYNQIRHRSLSLVMTVKDLNWLDGRLRYEADYEVKCRDLALTPWGRRNDISRGTWIHLEVIDLSGAFGGQPGKRIQKVIYPHGDIYWTAYNDKEIVGLEELYTGLKLDFKQRIISNKASVNAEYEEVISSLVNEFVSKGSSEVPCDTFRMIAGKQGIDIDERQLGRYLSAMGITRRQKSGGSRVYDLKNFEKRA